MARKTAMKKEPNISVALPNSEKERLGMPTRPSGRQQLQRLSPGVYRNQMGQLTSSTGRALSKRNPQQQPGNQIADAMNQQPQQRPEIATRPPAPLGTPPQDTTNFARDTGQFVRDMGQGSAPLGNMSPSMPQLTPEQIQQLLPYLKPLPLPQDTVNTGIYGGASPNYMAPQTMRGDNTQMQQFMMPSGNYNPYWKQQG